MAKSSSAILVIDLGLTNCKSVVFSTRGDILASASASYPTYHPAPGCVEQDTGDWWQAVCKATNTLWDAQPELALQIDGISVTGHMHALVCLNRDGETLGRALVLGDQRSADAATEIIREIGLPNIYQMTGTRMDASMPVAKIRWLREHAPEIHKDTHLFTGCKDYLRFRLTGDRFTDPIDACATSLYDIRSRSWSPELLAAADIVQGQLPEVRDSTAAAGTLQTDPGNALGLQAGIPVVVGGGDDVEVLGNGLMSSGASLEHIGTTGSILTCHDSPVYDPNMALELYPHGDPSLWVLGGSITTAGAALAWAAETLGYAELDEGLGAFQKLKPSFVEDPLIFIPHLYGERCPNWEPRVRGAWVGLAATHTRDDLMRAALEGVACALKSVLERIEGLVGKQKLVTVAARSNDNPDWLHLRANVYGRPLGLMHTPEPTALGAMTLSAVEIGLYKNLREAVNQVTSLERTIEPDTNVQSTYQQLYTTYQQLSAALLPVWPDH